MSRVEMAEQLAQQLPATRNLHESLSRAEELAIRRKHSVVGLDHLLLALGQDPDAVAILLACNVDVEALCMDLLRKIGPEARMIGPNTVPPTFDVIVQNLIAHASAAAQKSGQSEIGSPNILSAIISGEGGMITHKILQRHGLTFDEAISTLNRIVPGEKKAEAPKAKPAEEPANSTGTQQEHPNTPPAQSEQNRAPNRQQNEEAENNQQTATHHLNASLKKDDVLKGNSPDLTDNILDDSIVQSEAHPSDYGVTEDGSEDHPVPPQNRNAGPQNQRPNQGLNPNQGPNILMKSGPKFSGQNNPGVPHPGQAQGQAQGQSPGHGQVQSQGQSQSQSQSQVQPPHSLPPHANPDQRQNPQPAQPQAHRPEAHPDQRTDQQESKAAPRGQEPQSARQNSRINFGTSSFNPEPFNPPHNLQKSPDENDVTNNDRDYKGGNEPGAQPKQGANQGMPPLPPQSNTPPKGMPVAFPLAPVSPPSGTPALNPHQQHPSQHQPLPPHDKQSNPSFLQNKQGQLNNNPPHQPAPHQGHNQGMPARPVPAGQQHPHNLPPVNQETVDELATSIKRSQANLSATDTQDQVIENIPSVMRVGKMHFVEVRVARFTSAELDFGNENFGLRAKSDKGPVTKAITVRLTGPDGQFLIDSSTASTQWTEVQSGMVDDVDFAIWRWRVMPRRKGISKLRLDVTVRSSSENGITAEIPVQPSKSFEIKVTRNYARIFKSFFGLLVIFALGYGISQYGHQAYRWTLDKIEQITKPGPDE